MKEYHQILQAYAQHDIWKIQVESLLTFISFILCPCEPLRNVHEIEVICITSDIVNY